jgi:hypothetical protein
MRMSRTHGTVSRIRANCILGGSESQCPSKKGDYSVQIHTEYMGECNDLVSLMSRHHVVYHLCT